MLRGTVVALAGGFGLAVLVGPAIGQTYDSITLRVPVKLRNMHPDVKLAVVDCEIWGPEIMLRRYGSAQAIKTIGFDKVVEVTIHPPGGGTFTNAKAAVCSLFLSNKTDVKLGYQEPIKGTPPSANIWRLAKPDEYFMQTFRYPLDGAKFVPGIAGPKDDLTIQPKQKQ